MGLENIKCMLWSAQCVSVRLTGVRPARRLRIGSFPIAFASGGNPKVQADLRTSLCFSLLPFKFFLLCFCWLSHCSSQMQVWMGARSARQLRVSVGEAFGDLMRVNLCERCCLAVRPTCHFVTAGVCLELTGLNGR